jgi:Rrf2 family nitric oxide-sensitive transcriptional repressor
MISQTAEYALRAIVWLAEHEDRPLLSQEIAEGTQVPGNYLSKVLQLLRRAELVRARRGLGGGYSLTRSPSELTVLEVVNAADPLRRITQCPLDLPTHQDRLCPLHARLDDALRKVERSFAQTSIRDLMRSRNRDAPACCAP